jgi:hypothetical protein
VKCSFESRPSACACATVCRKNWPSTFTRHDLQREAFRYIDEDDRFRNMMARLEPSPELVLLMPDGRVGG